MWWNHKQSKIYHRIWWNKLFKCFALHVVWVEHEHQSSLRGFRGKMWFFVCFFLLNLKPNKNREEISRMFVWTNQIMSSDVIYSSKPYRSNWLSQFGLYRLVWLKEYFDASANSISISLKYLFAKIWERNECQAAIRHREKDVRSFCNHHCRSFLAVFHCE